MCHPLSCAAHSRSHLTPLLVLRTDWHFACIHPGHVEAHGGMVGGMGRKGRNRPGCLQLRRIVTGKGLNRMNSQLPDCWKIVEAVLGKVRTAYLHGGPGTGKTHAAVLATGRKDVIVTTLTDDTPAAELRGYDVPVDGKFAWRDGPWVKAWKTGALLVINELPRASLDTLSFALAILDNKEVAQATLPSGEVIRPADTFACIATGNEPPDSLPDALRDRFPVSLLIDALHPGALLRLPEGLRGPAAAAVAEEDPARRIGIRSWYEFAHLSEVIAPLVAAQACFGARAEEILDALTVSTASAQIQPAIVVLS